MKKILLLISIFNCFLSCESPPASMKSTGERVFKTNDPNKLYFKNIRSIKYELVEDPKTRIGYYRLKKLLNVSNRLVIMPIIVDNWLQSEVYLDLEAQNLPSNFDWKIYWEGENEKGLITLENNSALAKLKMIEEIAKHIKNKNNLSVKLNNNAPVKVLTDPLDQSNYLVVFHDFLRLTD